jgi:hypothetical protein
MWPQWRASRGDFSRQFCAIRAHGGQGLDDSFALKPNAIIRRRIDVAREARLSGREQ